MRKRCWQDVIEQEVSQFTISDAMSAFVNRCHKASLGTVNFFLMKVIDAEAMMDSEGFT